MTILTVVNETCNLSHVRTQRKSCHVGIEICLCQSTVSFQRHWDSLLVTWMRGFSLLLLWLIYDLSSDTVMVNGSIVQWFSIWKFSSLSICFIISRVPWDQGWRFTLSENIIFLFSLCCLKWLNRCHKEVARGMGVKGENRKTLESQSKRSCCFLGYGVISVFGYLHNPLILCILVEKGLFFFF